jgi:hypothetical protein
MFATKLPAKRQRPRMGIRDDGPLRCPAHLAWVRSHACSVPGCQEGPIEAAHVRTHGDGGMGMKPGDDRAVSLCVRHHREQHQRGEITFGVVNRVDLLKLAAEFAAASPALKRYHAKKEREHV